MPNELLETFIILGTIAVVVGIAKFVKYLIHRRNVYLLDLGRKEKLLNPFQQARKSTAVEFLEHAVNHRKSTLSELLKSNYITWNEYTKLYNALMKWKEQKLEALEHDAYLYL